MRLRKVNPQVIVHGKIKAVQAGLTLDTHKMESHYLAGGNVSNMVTAMIVANKSGLEPDWAALAAVDLSGNDVIDYVRSSGGQAQAPQPVPREPDDGWGHMVGLSATVESDVRPAGAVKIDGQAAVAVSQDGWIRPGVEVEIVDVITHFVVRQRGE